VHGGGLKSVENFLRGRRTRADVARSAKTEMHSQPIQEELIRAILAKPFWDYQEAALVLNIEVKTLRNMKCKREITYTTFGKKIYFSRDLIFREMRRNRVHCPSTVIAAQGTR
jgi:hypothetical protein